METRLLACSILGIFVVACQSGRGPAASPNAPAGSSDRASAGCPAQSTANASVADESGHTHVTVEYPASWKNAQPSPTSLALSLESSQLQIIVSASGGRTLQDAEVRAIHEQKVVPLCQRATELKKVDEKNDLRIFESTCYAPQETMVIKYHAGLGGIVVTTTESAKPLDPCTQKDVDRVFQSMRMTFSDASDRPTADDGLSSCPETLRTVPSGKGACLAPDTLGRDLVRACSAQLQKKGWKRNSAIESVIGAKTGKAQVCYDKP
jgi:hypothetical protein